MRKLIVLLTVALLCTAFAGTPFLSVGGSNDAMTAHWQAYDEGGEDTAACVVDDTDEYGLGDSTWMYNSDSIDLTDAETAYLTFSYMLDTADSNDYLAVYAVDYEPVSGDFDPDSETPLEVYDTTADDWTDETLFLSDHLGEGDVYIVFYWESDATDVAAGPRLNEACAYSWDGVSLDWNQVLYWNENHYGEAVNIDLSDGAGGTLAVDFHYDDSSWDWYCEVDNVVISDDSRAELINEQFESWPPTDWDIYTGETYTWVSNTTCYRSNQTGGSGNCADADSDYWYMGVNAHMVTPPIDCSGSDTVDLDFLAYYWDIGGGDYFEVLLGTAEISADIEDMFDDLDGWTTVDEGEYLNVVGTSWGTIKATF